MNRFDPIYGWAMGIEVVVVTARSPTSNDTKIVKELNSGSFKKLEKHGDGLVFSLVKKRL